MALSQSSSVSDALAQLNDNLSYEGNTTKALNALEAVRWLLFNRPRVSAEAGVSISFEQLEKQEENLAKYVNQVGQGSSARTRFYRGRPQ